MDLNRTSGDPGTDQKACVEHTRLRKVQGVAAIVLAVCGLLQLVVTHQDRQVQVSKSYDKHWHFAESYAHHKAALSLRLTTHHALKDFAFCR